MRDNILQENHSGGLAPHFGQDKTYAQLRSFYYWLDMRELLKGLWGNAEYVNMPKEEAKI